MMKHTHRWWNKTPPSVTVWVKPYHSLHSLQVRRGLKLKRANDTENPHGKSQRSQLWEQMYNTKVTMPPTIIIKRQEMMTYFRLFDDDLIQDFLWMDGCCKMTDKYLLAMTFVYFKRAHFTIAEYTRKNFFMALYLANTMEEDDEESKYEIFPWALGKNWSKHFPSFLKQRDKLWARIQFRAAVSRRCCEEVMAFVPSHSVWQRERSENHSGARRQCSDLDHAHFPRGPLASPVSCAICNHGSRVNQCPSSCSRGSSAQNPSPTSPHQFTLSMEATPPRASASRRKAVKTSVQTQRSPCRCAEEVSSDESCCGPALDTSMNWMCEE